MDALTPLSGQVAVITGAGAGIGRGHALELARRGARIVVVDRDPAGAETVVEEVRAGGGDAIAHIADVSTPEGGASVSESALDAFGRLDIIVNNAGIVRNGYFEDLAVHDIREILAVHVEAAFYVTQPAWRLLREQGYGRVVFTSSGAGVFGYQGMANYSAAKAAIFGLTRSLAFEARDIDLKVNCILPIATTGILAADPVRDGAKYAAEFTPAGFDPSLVGNRRSPDIPSRIVSMLVSKECPTSGEAYSISYGRFSRVFVAETPGWLAPDVDALSAEDVLSHFAEIADGRRILDFGSLHEEGAYSMSRLMEAEAERAPGFP